VTKRAVDLLLAVPAFVVSIPILVVLAALVRIDSRGPALYHGERVGHYGKPFHIYKLRTMQIGSESTGPPLTVRSDRRVTRLGRFLRATKVDELPQLLNVIKGEMSLVGPRPEHPEFVALYLPEHRRILNVRPGMTSVASIAYANEERLLGEGARETYLQVIMPAKLEMELRYIDQPPSTRDDLKIMLRTVSALFRR
jgi:lipopolysaccharide/colanic/teichoic acid biosynthesis glycosyltransferase